MRRWTVVLLAAVVLGVGCFGSSPAARFYTLSTIAPPAGAPGAPERTVRVAPVSLPDALDRPQLMRRTGATTISLEEFDRWVEPLDTLLRNALALDLTALLPDAQVLGSSAPGLLAQQTVVVALERLDVAQELSVEAVWFVLNLGDDQPRTTHRARFTEPVGGQPGDAAGAVSRAVERLSRDIAAELKATPPPPMPSLRDGGR